MDWNTFFSTLSQSAAGLISIVAAFVISKLLGENEKQETYDSQISKLIIDYNDIIKRISIRKFGWYDRLNIEHSHDVVDAIREGNFLNLSDNEKLTLLFSLESHLFKTDECLMKLNEMIVNHSPRNTGLGTFRGSPMILAPNGIWDKLGQERELINQLQIDSSTLINKFKDVRSDFLIVKNGLDSFKYTLYILAFGFFLTVIYPLHLMPIEIGKEPELELSIESIYSLIFSIKGLFIFLLSIVVIAIFGYFFLVIQRIKKKYLTLEEELKEDYFHLVGYCKYF
ncbi:hypothetical protein C8C83_4412 [Flavobacterium sp. 90]|uniref:hypothetical protein n=1 Tax=unclassified Flavobacterium TaxID=196869 RepID=UPI000EAFEBA9|nr:MULTISPECIES: hypothetical protein [unclassified Flavobacterium]RKR05083.1 hypothetical protein C8C82_4752 [Flavobacterium sp. 81]TCK56399.1 hypothetical protein C8C83_4412 [Flavobacterium sp. 90]